LFEGTPRAVPDTNPHASTKKRLGVCLVELEKSSCGCGKSNYEMSNVTKLKVVWLNKYDF
jgi:hypothetical protein